MTSKEFTEAQRLQAGPMAKDNPFARPAPTPEQIDNLRGRIAVLVKRGGNDGLLTNLDVNLLATLTAAAGVDPLKAWDSGFEEAVKRCAQVVKARLVDDSDSYPGDPELGQEIVDLILALKDKP